jgi:site-specific DNA-methyltransferase (adenine-specific)
MKMGTGKPTPYYQDSHCVIYHGDCLDILPHLEPVDLVLTDPPYVLSSAPPGESHYGMSLSKFEGEKYQDLTCGFDQEIVFPLVASVTQPFNLFCFCSNKQISDLMTWGESAGHVTTLLVWHKPNAAPFANGVWRGDAEFCIHIRGKGAVFQGNAEQKRKVTSSPTVRFDGHPTVKPLSLVRKYIEIGSELGDVVLDPFMGSGTTLVAAKELGRKAIGIEISREYCDIAVKRLRQEVLF